MKILAFRPACICARVPINFTDITQHTLLHSLSIAIQSSLQDWKPFSVFKKSQVASALESPLTSEITYHALLYPPLTAMQFTL